MVVKRMEPHLLSVPSTFLTGSGVTKDRNVSLCFLAKSWSGIIPSAPLSSSARALISRPDFFPIRDTLNVIEGERLFRIVSPGTGSESNVSNSGNLCSVAIRDALTDSAAVGPFKNPHC